MEDLHCQFCNVTRATVGHVVGYALVTNRSSFIEMNETLVSKGEELNRTSERRPKELYYGSSWDYSQSVLAS